MATADTNTLFATFKPAVERGGERLGGDIFADPHPGLLEDLLGKCEASQLSICLWKEEEVHGDEIQQKGRVGNQPDGTGGEPVLIVAAALMTGKLFQQQIIVKNGPDDKTLQARA